MFIQSCKCMYIVCMDMQDFHINEDEKKMMCVGICSPRIFLTTYMYIHVDLAVIVHV